MREFVDLSGASGASYRFKLTPRDRIPLRIAGNYAVVKPRGEAVSVLLVAETNDLSRVHELCAEAGVLGAVYVRLNVARSTREAEHQDLVNRYLPKQAAAAE